MLTILSHGRAMETVLNPEEYYHHARVEVQHHQCLLAIVLESILVSSNKLPGELPGMLPTYLKGTQI